MGRKSIIDERPPMEVEYEVYLNYDGHTTVCISKNISINSINLYTEQALDAGLQTDLSIFIKDANLNFQAKGIVKSCEELPGPNYPSKKYIIGIEFIEGHENGLPFLKSKTEKSRHAFSQTVSIDADVRTCYKALSQIDKFPEWDSACESAQVLSRYPDGRPKQVKFKRNFILKKAEYTDEFSYDDGKFRVSWESQGGDMDLVSNVGGYSFKTLGTDKTLMTFQIDVTLGLILSSRVINYLTSIAARKEMKNFKKYVEKMVE